MNWYTDEWFPYVSVAERRIRALQEIAAMKKAGHEVSPVEIAGRRIAKTFWGEAWCKNLEAYSDYANRLPRGRTYVRNGSVMHLSIAAGRVQGLVMGSDLYEVEVEVKPIAKQRWEKVKRLCAGRIDSLVELLRGSLSKGVMEIVTLKGEGLFPSPREITLECSCPDWATLCKHVAAVLYGVGSRLDREPEKLFTLRAVDPAEMIEAAVRQPPVSRQSRRNRVLASGDLSAVFGVDIDMTGASGEAPVASAPRRGSGKKAAVKKAAVKKPAVNKPARCAQEEAPSSTRVSCHPAGNPLVWRCGSSRAPRRLRARVRLSRTRSQPARHTIESHSSAPHHRVANPGQSARSHGASRHPAAALTPFLAPMYTAAM